MLGSKAAYTRKIRGATLSGLKRQIREAGDQARKNAYDLGASMDVVERAASKARTAKRRELEGLGLL